MQSVLLFLLHDGPEECKELELWDNLILQKYKAKYRKERDEPTESSCIISAIFLTIVYNQTVVQCHCRCHAGVESVIAGLAPNMGFGHQMISWLHFCYQGIVDLLGVF